MTINDLRCENLSEPVGIGTAIPRFSWKVLSDKNGTAQKAYQIIVASQRSLLDDKNADLWNSGKTISPASVLVPYQGTKLSSRSVCYWKVRVWDENDKTSAWSDAAIFNIGLLKRSDWQADYIGFNSNGESDISPQLRTTFDFQGKADTIFLYINSLGYHEIYLNGEKAGDNVLAPAVSQFNKRSLALCYDIASLVRKGRNDIVLWIGQGWYRAGLPGVISEGPLVKAQIEEYNNGVWSTILCTDLNWKGRSSGYYNTGTWRPGEFGGELVRGRLLLPDLKRETLDKVTWEPVVTARPPDHEVSPQMSESNRIIEEIRPADIQSAGDSTWLIDMGKSLTGWLELRFPYLEPGQEVVMEYCDHLDSQGKFANQKYPICQTDRYIASGENGEYFINKFNYHSFRYLKISNLGSEPTKENIKALLIHTNYKMASSFECSDPDLNKIHDMIFYTLRCLSLGGYLVDCSHIERLGYGGDGNANTETAQTMFDLAPLYNNWLQAWADCIREDGGMPHTAPNPYRAGGGPYWCGFIITASWRTYMNYGDLRVLEKYYPVMQKWLEYVEKHSPDGLLEPWPETDYRSWYLGDWAVPEGLKMYHLKVDQATEASVSLVNNSFITICYEIMQKIAEALGKKNDLLKYESQKEKMRELVHRKLYDESVKKYGSGSQIDLTYPLLAGIVPDSLIKDVKQNLFNEIEINHKGHIACGIVGIAVFTEWVVKEKEADLMYSILKKKGYPGYLYMIDNGATTTWEHWNGRRSRIHSSYNGIGSWFYQAIGGIRTDKNFAGYRRLIIDPQIPEGITWANTTKETPCGTVSVNWRIEDEILKMKIKIPVGSTARIIFPGDAESYILNGKSIRNEAAFIETGSGDYDLLLSL